MADSSNGYVSNFEVYVGKPSGEGGREVGLGKNVVKRLTNQLQGKNHHVYFDNYFNSVQLHEELNEVGTYGCGTVRANSKGLPEAMRATCDGARHPAPKMNPGDYKVWQKGGITACIWQEKAKKKPVKMLSSNTNPMEPERKTAQWFLEGNTLPVAPEIVQ